MKMRSIRELQQDIIKEFRVFGGDKQSIMDHIIGWGQDMHTLPRDKKRDIYLVSNCLSKVWIVPEYVEDRLFLLGDSNALVTRGLVGLLLHVFSGQLRSSIATEPFFLNDAIDFSLLLSSQRRGGFHALVAYIRTLARKE